MDYLQYTKYEVRDEKLVGKYYKCIFDEKTRKLDGDKPHLHEIMDAYRINAPGYIYNGLALQLKGRGDCYGCPEEYVVEKKGTS